MAFLAAKRSLIKELFLIVFVYVPSTQPFPTESGNLPLSGQFARNMVDWLKPECVFPSKTAFGHGIVNTNDFPLKACSDDAGMSKKWSLCSSFFEISSLFCRGKLTPTEKEYLSQTSLEELIKKKSTLELCTEVKEKNLKPFLWLKQEQSPCNKCEDKELQPVCNLLFAGVLNYLQARKIAEGAGSYGNDNADTGDQGAPGPNSPAAQTPGPTTTRPETTEESARGQRNEASPSGATAAPKAGGSPAVEGGTPQAGGSPAVGGSSPEVGGPHEGGGSPAVGGGSPAVGGGSPAVEGGNPLGGGSPAVEGGKPLGGGSPAVEGGTPVGGGSPAVEGGNPLGGGSPTVGGTLPGGGSPAVEGGNLLGGGSPAVEGGKPVGGGSPAVEGGKPVGGGSPAVEGGNPLGGGSPAVEGGNPLGGGSPAVEGGNPVGGGSPAVEGGNPLGGASPAVEGGNPLGGGSPAVEGGNPLGGGSPAVEGGNPLGGGIPVVGGGNILNGQPPVISQTPSTAAAILEEIDDESEEDDDDGFFEIDNQNAPIVPQEQWENGAAQHRPPVQKPPVQKPPTIPEDGVQSFSNVVEYNFKEEEAPSGHFMAYFITAIVLCVAGYVIYHNKQKIFAIALEGRRDSQRRRASSGTDSSAKYSKLQSTVEEVVPALEKSTTSKNYIY